MTSGQVTASAECKKKEGEKKWIEKKKNLADLSALSNWRRL